MFAWSNHGGAIRCRGPVSSEHVVGFSAMKPSGYISENGLSEVLFEFRRVGTYLRVCAIDPDTRTEVIMIGAHLGAGIPFFLQMPEIRRSLPNLLFDTAAAPLLYGERCVARLVDLVGVDRVLFASDFPLRNPIKDFKLAVEDLSEEDAYAIGALNARRVLLTND